ncbi:hypothetical protein BLNAU_8955 [Blattamonas nauphoetae]|uniref:Uncharacterized protein n=1 Tax=Blattamonas nauphoetae TaxID=2049346 RepID=A0ABQ9XXG6_9EUKA|nr:hypothetical protein BLNAU_8955 [Blattamonas nauphoetae]
MYRQERAGRTEQDTARTESDSEIQRRTGQPNNDELRSRTERGGRKRMGHEPKKGNGPRRQIHPIRSEKQSEMVLLHRSHSLPFATGVVGVLFFTLAECTLPYFGEEGRVWRVVGSETNFGAGFECCGERIPFPRENRSIVTRTGLGGSFKFAWSFGGERGL